MHNLLIPILLLAAVTAYAGEPIIVETETAIMVEYTGSSPDTGGAVAKPAAGSGTVPSAPAASPAMQVRTRFLAAQIGQLQKEARDILNLSGDESPEALAGKSALAAEKNSRAIAYADEYRQITGNPPPELSETQNAAAGGATQSEAMNKRNDREERIRRTKDMRRSQASLATSTP